MVLNGCLPFDRRGLRFIQVFLQSICDGERDENHPNLIRVNANKAYEMALKKYHGWLVQKIFKVSATGPEDSGSLLCKSHPRKCRLTCTLGWSQYTEAPSAAWPTLLVAVSAP